MGIRGLYKYVETEKAYEIVDLIRAANENGGIEILVDFNAYQRDLLGMLSSKMSSENDNNFLLFPGGEFDMLHQFFYEYHKIFEISGIKLVWLIDGPKGVDEESSDQKRETWMKRGDSDLDKCNTILSACSLKFPPHDPDSLVPLSSSEVSLKGLKDAGAEVIQLLQGESDEYIALEFHRRNSYAIITNDTDFLIFPDCRVIFSRMMNLCYKQDNLMLPVWDNENPGSIFKAPSSFKCPIVTQSHVLNLFQLRSYEQLVAMSVLKGNDNTLAFSQELQCHLKITSSPNKNAHVTIIAKYIRNNSITIENILDLPAMRHFAESCPQLIPAIEFCREFYSLKRIKNIKESLIIYKQGAIEDPLTDFFAQKLSRLELCKEIYSLHHGIINDTIYIENPSNTCPPISTILSEMNALVYPYILNKKLGQVNEWRSRGDPRIHIVPVSHSALKTNDILPSSNPNGISFFEKVWSHLESNGESLDYVNKFGLQCGFLCYLLRYFYQLTNHQNLQVSTNEFKALFISVFYHYGRSQNEELKTQIQRETFLGLKICPSERCIIINFWFLRIFFNGKYICGGAFNLTDKFPSTQNVINASVLYAFYESIMTKQNKRIEHLDGPLQNSIASLADQIFKRYEIQFAMVTK